MVLDFLAVDNFDFTRKIVKKNLDEKLVKMLGFCQNWIFGQKFDFSNSVLKTKICKIRKMLHTGTRTPNSGIKLDKQKNCSNVKIKNFWET